MARAGSARLLLLGAVAGLGFGEARADVRPLNEEPSKYGRFEVVKPGTGTTCRVRFRSRVGAKKTTELFTTLCHAAYTDEGVMALGAHAEVGAVALPFTSKSGDEFHLFSIATDRGGNACMGSDHWAVVVNGANVWATRRSFSEQCVQLEDAKVIEKDGKASIVFSVPSTTTEEGREYTVSMGRVATVKLAKKPRSVTATKTVVIEGSFLPHGPVHMLPALDDRKAQHVITNAGSCALGKLTEGRWVQMTATHTTWSDGDTELTCTAIKPK